MEIYLGFRLCSVSNFLPFSPACVFIFFCFASRYHHDIESYKLKKPIIIEGLDKVKDAVTSFMGNHEQAAEVAGGVNIVSDGMDVPLAEDYMSNNIAKEALITGTQ